MSEPDKHIISEPKPDYEKAETDLLRDALKRTHKERVLFLHMLMKIQASMRHAKITHQPFPKP